MNDSRFEYIHPGRKPNGKIKAAVFDFDGTISTLRCGWESVMRPLMLEMISGGPADNASDELKKEVSAYINESTGIQTVYQMIWLRDRVKQAGLEKPDRDEWWYKEEYNRRLMQRVNTRLERLEKGEDIPEKYLIYGTVTFLKTLSNQGVKLFLASGTDHQDVVREAESLGVAHFFAKIQGAPEHMAACSKEAVIRMILEEEKLAGEELLLVGDGKVEIALGRDAGAYTLGVATDEEVLHGINPTKKKRLITAGADVVTGDFTEYNHILSWLGYEPQFNGRTQALLEDFFTCHSELTSLRAETELGVSLWVETFRNNHKILLCGNGGSAADCDHIAGELLKGFLLKRSIKSELKRILASLYGEEGERLGQSLQQGLPAIALTTHGAAISAFANDVDAEYVYAQQVLALGKPGDLLVGISTSGNARNVDAAMKTAKAIGMCTMGLAGKTGGKLSHISDICMIIPEKQTYRIQEYHLMLYHLLCAATESELFEQ